MGFETILLEVDRQIATITLNVPQTKNALSPHMRADLIAAFEGIRDDKSVKVVVVTGSGNTFCSGGDIGTMADLTPVGGRIRLKQGQQLIRTMVELEKPILAAINGYAIGAGTSLALACDILIAADGAEFAVNFVKIGAIPDLGALYSWALRAGVSRAKALMFSGDLIDAREAEGMGLINRVVPPDRLQEEVTALAARLAEGPSQCYAMIKAALNRWPADLETFLEMESTMQAVAFSSEDFKEGRQAFLEKRKPRFRGI
jgi:2-(1,2-epoxy-1,2-dihydrophenyl)acetyl-CoA isomerase